MQNKYPSNIVLNHLKDFKLNNFDQIYGVTLTTLILHKQRCYDNKITK